MRKALTHLAVGVCLLSFAVLATISLAWLLYPMAIDGLELERFTGLSKERLWLNFNHLMTYLTLPWVGQLAMPDFPSSASGLKHFADVKELFHLTQVLWLLTLYPTWHWLRENRYHLANYRYVFWAASLSPLILGGFGLLVGFDTFFVLFHQVLFPNDQTWLFNPAMDPVINALPAHFFLYCFLLFGGIYEAISIGLLVLTYQPRKEML